MLCTLLKGSRHAVESLAFAKVDGAVAAAVKHLHSSFSRQDICVGCCNVSWSVQPRPQHIGALLGRRTHAAARPYLAYPLPWCAQPCCPVVYVCREKKKKSKEAAGEEGAEEAEAAADNVSADEQEEESDDEVS